MSGKRYAEELKIEAVMQVTEGGYPVAQVAQRLGVSAYSLYQWIKQYGLPGLLLPVPATHCQLRWLLARSPSSRCP